MTPAVVVKALSKRFRRVGGGRLRAMIDSAIGRRAGCLWAVRDVSFEVARGEVLGIIGPNGAGKSTLLKMLAGILRPTSGQVEHLGRLSALIELGAGFHPDLTGRENVRLNGAILGVSQRAIVARMDEIAEFAGLRDSMHMPVKHFSSGMTARLGFSIAAHVDPEILLVDEVLSVGDRVFRARCLDRMNSLLRRGATVVFVSHDLRTVCSFCDRVMLLDRGRAVFTGSAGRAVTEYQRLSDVRPVREVSGEADLVVEGMRLVDAHGVERGEAAGGEGFALEAEVSVRRAVPAPGLAIQVIRRWDELMVGRVAIPVSDETRIHLRARMRAHLLPGEYEFRIEATSGGLPVRVASRGRPAWLLVTGATVAGGVAELGPQISFSLAGAATHHHE